MDRWVGKIAVITGTSSGIGLETAKALMHHGMIVVGLSRRLETMQDRFQEAIAAGKFYAKKCDVVNENEVIDAFEWVEKTFQTVHVLVNNAGYWCNSSVFAMETKDMLSTININVVGLLHCTRQAAKLMKKNEHEAHIVNINSVSGHKVFNLSGNNVYPATKYAVTALSETLIHEIKGNKIRVTSISPGIVATEFFDNSGLDPELLNSLPSLKPEDVANSIVHVISTPQHVQIVELTIKPFGEVW